MRFILALLLTLAATQAFAAASIVPAFGCYSNPTGGKICAGQSGSNTAQVIGATVGKVGGKPTLTVPGNMLPVVGLTANTALAASGNGSLVRTALAAAKSSSNLAVTIPGGTYYVDNSSGPITIPVGVTLRGAGKYWDGGTTIVFTDSTQDGFVLATAVDGGSPGIEDMWITGAKRGVYNQTGGMITAKRLTLDGNVIGIELDGTNYSHFEDIKASNNGTGGILTYNGIRFADQNTFINCRWDKNTGMGLVKRKGTGNSFISNTFVGNEGIGLYLEDPSASVVDGNFMWYPNHTQSAPDLFINPYFEDVFGGTNTDELLKIVNVWNTEFIGATFMNYYSKTNGAINLARAGRTKINGMVIDTAAPLISNFVNVGFASWETAIDLVGINQASVVDKGINTKIGSRWNVDSTAYDSEASTMSNVTFGTAGAGGADVLANWTENGATDIQLDTSDLMYPGTASSLVVHKATPAVSSSVTQATRTLTSGKTYYINITYKNDSATTSKLSPITVGLQKAAGGYLDYNFVDGTWAYSNAGKSLALPISTTPYSISIPFTIPSATAAQLTVSFNAYSGDNDGATYHLYRASIDTVPNSGNVMATVQAANSPVASLGASVVPFTDLTGKLLSGSLKYDNVNKVLNVGSGVDATPVIQIEGTSNASIRTKDTGAGADAKVMLYRTDGGKTSFSSLTDAGAYKKQDIISLDHATGAASFGFGGSANHAICWKADGKTLGYCSAVVASDGTCGTCN